ncbi:MAG: hypothetical protein CVV21_10885 [Candidatus Goldiibacteriota bacterium HGW-Goldbacteria-1]|nr:MAG: hypothetical protein CVV21_10885 [Candidatus Goldiibacteriota bacterium HGW-Goldbacteria-1]
MKQGVFSEEKRIELVLAVFVFVLGVLFVRLLFLQVIMHSALKDRADKGQMSTVKKQIGRGAIYDSTGRQLAMSIKTETICVTPRNVKHKDRAADFLSKKLGLSRQFVLSKLKSRSGFEYIKRKVPSATADEILDKKIPGVFSRTEEKRYYPYGEITAHITGFAGTDNKGLEGIEMAYEKYMKGKLGREEIRVDAKRRPILIGNKKIKKGERGADIYTTIDGNIQYAAYRQLEETVNKSRAKSGSIIVMNPETGAIYAAVNYPSYDPNTPSTANADKKRNRIITDMYEPGSTFKIFTMAAYLEKFPNSDDEKTYCGMGKEVFKIGKYNRTIHDHEKHGDLTATEIIKVSSNIGTVKLAMKLKPADLYQEYLAYGFGSKTGIDLPGEVTGLLRNANKWDKVSITSVPYGQEVAVSSLQLVRAYAAIANGGKLVTPYLIEKIQKNGRTVYRHKIKKQDGPATGSRREKLVSMLEAVMEKDGSGKKAAVAGYRVAGKTGTAQKHKTDGKGYAANKYVASFIGFMPADNPKTVTLVTIDEPEGFIYYGGDLAGPIFRNLNTMMASYFKVLPDETVTAQVTESGDNFQTAKMPRIKDKTFNEAKLLLAEEKIKYQRHGFGKVVIAQEPEPGEKMVSGKYAQIFLGDENNDNKEKTYMPNVKGMTVRRAMEVLRLYGLNAKCSGSGFAVSQDPKPGVAMKKGAVCTVSFDMRDGV